MSISVPKMQELQKYITEMLIGINFDDIEELSLVIIQDDDPIEKFGLKITNLNGAVDENHFWNQARGILTKIAALDATMNEAIELSELEYTKGKRSFYIIALTNGRYPCSELDQWVPAEHHDTHMNNMTAIPLRTIENAQFKLETYAMLPTHEEMIPDSQ